VSENEFELQPVLHSSRVTIRPLQTLDWDALYAAASDPLIWAGHPATDRYTEPVFRDFFASGLAGGGALVFIDRDTQQTFGSSRYHDFDPAKRVVEIGWTFMSRDHWGGGYNEEIKTALLDHAFRFVDTVVFWVAESNQRSRAAMEKIGGQRLDGLHTRELSGDTPHLIYAISRADR
jgi:RimJ/RimL family protein N-acetyltransferase